MQQMHAVKQEMNQESDKFRMKKRQMVRFKIRCSIPSFSWLVLKIQKSTLTFVLSSVYGRNFTRIHFKPEIGQTKQSVP